MIRLWYGAGRVQFVVHGVSVGRAVRFYGLPFVRRTEDSEVVIGDRVVLCSHSGFTDLGVSHPVVIRTLREGARITIGNDVGLSGSTICAASSITIGAECLFGADVQVVDTDFHPIRPEGRRFVRDFSLIASRPIVIGRNVFLGAGTKVLKGVTIGDDSVIGAGSVVVSDIPAKVIAAGNPAKVIRSI